MDASGLAATVFDLDDTVCEHDQDPAELYAAAFDRAGLERFGEPGELWAALSGPPDPEDERSYFAAGFAVVAARNGRPEVDPDALAAGFLAGVEYGAVSYRPGAKRALVAAADRGPVAVLTNGPERRQAPKLETLGLLEGPNAVDAVVYAGDMERRKPHRDPFDRACERLGTEPAATLCVGNSLEYDVAGGQGAGMPVAWVPAEGDEPNERGPDGRPDPSPYDPEFVLASLEEFETVLEGR